MKYIPGGILAFFNISTPDYKSWIAISYLIVIEDTVDEGLKTLRPKKINIMFLRHFYWKIMWAGGFLFLFF